MAYIDALYKTHNWERMEMVLNERVKSATQREYAQTMLLSLAIARRDSARIQGLLQEPGLRLSAYDYNKLAWLALFQPALGDQALEYARKAVTMSNSQERAILHTMAALYAQTGRYEDARKLMQKCLEMSGDSIPKNEDWFVFGRIAEGYGFLQSARKSYEKVEKPANGEPNSTWELARRRLAALGN
jgi:tetratricopeptide (TPR) repeat protein